MIIVIYLLLLEKATVNNSINTRSIVKKNSKNESIYKSLKINKNGFLIDINSVQHNIKNFNNKLIFFFQLQIVIVVLKINLELLKSFGSSWIDLWRRSHQMLEDSEADLKKMFEEVVQAVKRKQLNNELEIIEDLPTSLPLVDSKVNVTTGDRQWLSPKIV